MIRTGANSIIIGNRIKLDFLQKNLDFPQFCNLHSFRNKLNDED